MIQNDTKMFLLLQMADSAFPVGGFAYSYGLESAVKHSFISNADDLREYLMLFAEQVISFELPFICSAYDQQKSVGDMPSIHSMLNTYRVMLMNPPLLKASYVMGRNWLKICKQISDNEQLNTTHTLLQQEGMSFEFPIVFGLCMKDLEFSLPQVLYLFFYMSLRDQISALIRLGAAGPSMAHTELQHILNTFSEQIHSYIPVPYTNAYKSAYLLELAQLSHDRVYSKLFQN